MLIKVFHSMQPESFNRLYKYMYSRKTKHFLRHLSKRDLDIERNGLTQKTFRA